MLINKWGRYAWCDLDGISKIHPDDLEEFKKVASNVRVFHAIEQGVEYLTIQHGKGIYRVKSELFEEVKNPRFVIGEEVYINDSILAVVCDDMWHYDKKAHYYLVSVKGKKKSKRYFEDELETFNS